MTWALPYQLRLRSRSGRERRTATGLRLLITGLTALGLSQAMPLPSAFGQSYYYYGGSLTATIPLFTPVRSIVLNAGSLTFTTCQTNHSTPQGPVALPGLTRTDNAECVAGPVTVTLSGTTGGEVQVQGSNATPDIAGPGWTLLPTPATSLNSADQFSLLTFSGSPSSLPISNPPSTTPSQTQLSTTAEDDLVISTGNLSSNSGPGASATESFWLQGPSATSNANATLFSTTITWSVI